MTLSRQAMNSIALYKGQNPATIEQLLNFQSQSVVNELMTHFDARTLRELAMKLSMAK